VAALDPVQAHQPLDTLAVDGVPKAPQLGNSGLRTGDPPVGAGARDMKDPAYPLNTEGLGMGGDEVQRRAFTSSPS
jgi:hypothetical protein